MKYGHVPHLDKPVSRIVAGTDYLMYQSPDTSFRAYDTFWEAGGRAFDSAFGYGDNTTMLGAWIRSRGVLAESVLFDKLGQAVDGVSSMRRDIIRTQLDRNHRYLGVDRTDLCVLHKDDEEVPVPEIVDWLNELIAENRFSAFGGSNWRLDRIKEGNEYAARVGKQGFSVSNPTFSLAVASKPLWLGCITMDTADRPWYEETNFPLFLWSSTARGYFADTQDADVLGSYDTPDNRARRERARGLAAEKGVDTVGIALAYVLSQPMNVFALCGLRTVEQAKANTSASEVVLTPEELVYLETGTR